MNISAKYQARRLALKRRIPMLFGKEFDPYPARPPESALDPAAQHLAAYKSIPRAMAWKKNTQDEPREWQIAARQKLIEISGYMVERPTPSVLHEETHTLPNGLSRHLVYLRAGPDLDIPVSLISNAQTDPSKGIMICLQGTNSGAHISWGEAYMPADPLKIEAGGDFARQAVARGYLAVCIEQSGFGERRERAIKGATANTTAANHAYLLGRSLVGERATDVSSVIDWLGASDAGDDRRIFAMGSSSGGTSAIYAAAMDDRVCAVLASGCIGYIGETILRRYNEGQAVVPGILNHFEFDDVLALIAPRPLIGVSGLKDHIFPFDGCERAMDSASSIYKAFNATHALKAVAGDAGHRFYPDIAWPAFEAAIETRP